MPWLLSVQTTVLAFACAFGGLGCKKTSQVAEKSRGNFQHQKKYLKNEKVPTELTPAEVSAPPPPPCKERRCSASICIRSPEQCPCFSDSQDPRDPTEIRALSCVVCNYFSDSNCRLCRLQFVGWCFFHQFSTSSEALVASALAMHPPLRGVEVLMSQQGAL